MNNYDENYKINAIATEYALNEMLHPICLRSKIEEENDDKIVYSVFSMESQNVIGNIIIKNDLDTP